MLRRESTSGLSIVIILAIVIGATVTGLVTAHNGDADSIHACVNKNGQVRIIDPAEDCTTLPGQSWEPLDWPASSADTALTEVEVEDFITNGPIDLDGSSTLGGQSISTGSHTADQDWNALTNVPADIADGDDDALGGLSCNADQPDSYRRC